MNTVATNPPAHLWIGPDAILTTQVQEYLQKVFCTKNGCHSCITCTQIRDRQHHGCLWFYPEGHYTLDMLQPFFTTIAHSLDTNQRFFFIFHHADYLSTTCTNSLLKSIEEPPPGYTIIFLAQNLHALAPTLRSRCVISHHAHGNNHESVHDLASFFTTIEPRDPQEFLACLDSSLFDERSITNLLDHIVHYWQTEYKKIAINNNAHDIEQRIHAIIQTLQQAIAKQPMPGSYKIFLRNLFLSMYTN